jgi:hypothetical protein
LLKKSNKKIIVLETQFQFPVITYPYVYSINHIVSYDEHRKIVETIGNSDKDREDGLYEVRMEEKI